MMRQKDHVMRLKDHVEIENTLLNPGEAIKFEKKYFGEAEGSLQK